MAHTRRDILGGVATLCVSPGLAMGQLATKKGEPSSARDNHVRKFYECDSASRNLQAIYFDENGEPRFSPYSPRTNVRMA